MASFWWWFRGTESEEDVQKRLQTARAEMARASDRSLFDHTLVNDDLGKCYQRLKDVLGLTPRADDTDGLPGERQTHPSSNIRKLRAFVSS